MGGGVSQYEWEKLCRPFQAVKNISFHPSFKPSVTERKVAHQLLLNGKFVTNMSSSYWMVRNTAKDLASKSFQLRSVGSQYIKLKTVKGI